jgi:hypothetical protein
MGINLDGTDVALFAADEGRLNKRMPCATPSGQIVFVESDTNTPDGGGNLASVETRRPLHSYVQISKPGDGYYRAPSALDEEDLLVAKRPASGTAVFSIYRFQPKTGLSVKIYGDPVRSIVQAKAVVPHAMPEGRSSVVDEKDPNGKLYCLSVFHTELPGEMKHDASNIKRVRVLEGVPASADQKASRLLEKRVLGEFDVDPDGSFHVRLPALRCVRALGSGSRTNRFEVASAVTTIPSFLPKASCDFT